MGSSVKVAGSSGIKDDSDIKTGNNWNTGRLGADGENEDGTFGGHVFVWAEAIGGSPSWWGGDAFAYAWWKPIEQFKLQLGHNPWGDIDRKAIVDWGFHASDAPDIGMSNSYGTGDNDLAAGTGFYGGFGDFGSLLSIYPVSGLEINVGLAFADREAEETYKRLHAQVAYTIDGIGTAAVTYTGALNELTVTGIDTDGDSYDDDFDFDSDASSIYASFLLTAVENMQFNIGLGYTLATKSDLSFFKVTYNSPIAAGLGFSMNATDEFVIKARVAATFAGSIKPDSGDAYKYPLKLGFTVLPAYDLGIMKILAHAGIMYTAASKDWDDNDVDAAFGWHFNPYVMKSVGSGTFFAGFRVESDGIKGSSGDGDKSAISWSIPVGLTFGF